MTQDLQATDQSRASEASYTRYEEALAHEERQRDLGYLRFTESLFGLPQVPLKWGHLREFSLAGNAFFTNADPGELDVWLYLWRLHPFFTRPGGDQPNRFGLPRAGFLRVLLARWQVWRTVRRVNHGAGHAAIYRRILDAYQDAPAADPGAGSVSSLVARNKWFDYFAQDYQRRGLPFVNFLDLGIAWTFQMHRADDLAHHEGADTRYIPPSAALKRAED